MLVHEKKLRINFEFFTPDCKLVPIYDAGFHPYGWASTFGVYEPSAYEIKIISGSTSGTVTKTQFENIKHDVYKKAVPEIDNYNGYGINMQGSNFYVFGGPVGTFESANLIYYTCPEPGVIEYSTNNKLEETLLYTAQHAPEAGWQIPTDYSYCAIAWLKLRCLVLGKLD